MIEMKERFQNCVERLKNLGFKGEVLVNKDGVFIVSHDSFSTCLLKKSTASLSKENKEASVFYQPRGSVYGFFCYSTEGLKSAKKASKALASELLMVA